ncbi:keratin-associated protein 10-1-like isoform X1 [Ostrinia nubilalis]|uniref:keratin-associated protein 10-1-like isoform X1 n=1 Tax=Ostrinia nubilalis TaxID=29057 RepID=UPI0030823F81
MACCYPEDCGEYAVTPMLIAPCLPTKCCEDPPVCYPCLPRCPKGQMVYCCEKRPPPRQSQSCESDEGCCDPPPAPRQKCSRPPPAPRQSSSCAAPPNCCPTCCRPMKTKYVIPCYRYEDGRITNQPTLLMRRACEVAVGARQRRKPFVLSTYSADPYNVEQRYHCEDERGNCCFHFERKKPMSSCCSLVPSHHHHHPCPACQPCVSSPQCQYTDCVHARVVDSTWNRPSCCYYC